MASNYSSYYVYPYAHPRSRSYNDLSEIIYHPGQVQQPMYIPGVPTQVMITPVMPVPMSPVPMQYSYSPVPQQNVMFTNMQRGWQYRTGPYVEKAKQSALVNETEINTPNHSKHSNHPTNNAANIQSTNGQGTNGPARYRGRHQRSVSTPLPASDAQSRERILNTMTRNYAPSTSSSQDSSIDSDSLQLQFGSSATSMHSANSSTQEEDYSPFKRKQLEHEQFKSHTRSLSCTEIHREDPHELIPERNKESISSIKQRSLSQPQEHTTDSEITPNTPKQGSLSESKTFAKPKKTVSQEPARNMYIGPGAQLITPEQHAARLQNAKRNLAENTSETIRVVSSSSNKEEPQHANEDEHKNSPKSGLVLPSDEILQVEKMVKTEKPEEELEVTKHRRVGKVNEAENKEKDIRNMDQDSSASGQEEKAPKKAALSFSDKHEQVLVNNTPPNIGALNLNTSRESESLNTPLTAPQPTAMSFVSNAEPKTPEDASPIEAASISSKKRGNSFQVLPKGTEFPEPKTKKTFAMKLKNVFGGGNSSKKGSRLDSDQTSISSSQSMRSNFSIKSSVSLRSLFGGKKQRSESAPTIDFHPSRPDRAYQSKVHGRSKSVGSFSVPALDAKNQPASSTVKVNTIRSVNNVKTSQPKQPHSPALTSEFFEPSKPTSMQCRPPSPALRNEAFDSPSSKSTPVTNNTKGGETITSQIQISVDNAADSVENLKKPPSLSLVAGESSTENQRSDLLTVPPTNLSAGDISPRALTEENVENLVCVLSRTNSISSKKENSRSSEDHVPNPMEVEASLPLKREDTKKLPSAMKSLNRPMHRHRSGATRNLSVSFASKILIYRTFSSEEYNRRPDWMTSDIIREPGVAQMLREELNEIKAKMKVHPQSVHNTQFFYAKPVVYKK